MAVGLARDGEAAFLLTGHIHTDDLMRAVLDKQIGLRTGRRLSHVFVCYLPANVYPKALMVTDAARNIAPDLETKQQIAQNAIDLAHALGSDVRKRVSVALTSRADPPAARLAACAIAELLASKHVVVM